MNLSNNNQYLRKKVEQSSLRNSYSHTHPPTKSSASPNLLNFSSSSPEVMHELPPPLSEETETRTVFVGDLSIFCTEQHLHDLFIHYGSVESVQLKASNDGKPHLSYGFVRFKQHEFARNAIQELDGQIFLGRAIRVSWASDNPQRKLAGQRKRVSHENTAQIHVSFTAKDSRYTVTESILRDLYSRFGELFDVTIKKTMFDKKTGCQTGYGFVHYALNQSGVSSAYMAVQSTNQITIDSVTFECALSNTLKSYIASLSERERFYPPTASALLPHSPTPVMHAVPPPANFVNFPRQPTSYHLQPNVAPSMAAYPPGVVPNQPFYYPVANSGQPTVLSPYPYLPNLPPQQQPLSYVAMPGSFPFPPTPPVYQAVAPNYFDQSQMNLSPVYSSLGSSQSSQAKPSSHNNRNTKNHH